MGFFVRSAKKESLIHEKIVFTRKKKIMMLVVSLQNRSCLQSILVSIVLNKQKNLFYKFFRLHVLLQQPHQRS
jgi:hypothetical protein